MSRRVALILVILLAMAVGVTTYLAWPEPPRVTTTVIPRKDLEPARVPSSEERRPGHQPSLSPAPAP